MTSSEHNLAEWFGYVQSYSRIQNATLLCYHWSNLKRKTNYLCNLKKVITIKSISFAQANAKIKNTLNPKRSNVPKGTFGNNVVANPGRKCLLVQCFV